MFILTCIFLSLTQSTSSIAVRIIY